MKEIWKDKNSYFVRAFIFLIAVVMLLSVTEIDGREEKIVLIEATNKELNADGIVNIIVLHDFGASLVARADESLISDLNKKEIRYQILASSAANLYILSSKRGNVELTSSEDYEILYSHLTDNDKPVYLMKAAAKKLPLFRHHQLIPLAEITTEEEYLQRYLTYNQSILADEDIQSLATNIDPAQISAYLQHLQDYQTRYFLHPNRREIVMWLYDEFLSFGFIDVVIDSFYIEKYNWGNFPPSWQYNLVATLKGSSYPDNYLIIGGHYDSIIFDRYGNPMEVAPGVDDNGSGVAALLTIAKTMSDLEYQPQKSIRFIPFAAEEIGLFGSRDISNKFAEEEVNIDIMVNNDMIANIQEDDDWKVFIYPYGNHLYVSELAEAIFSDFTTLTPIISTINNPASDSYSFYQNGFPTLFFHEYDFSPVYHSPDDILDNCDVVYAAEITKATLFTTLYMDRIPEVVSDIRIANKGCGSEVVVNWKHTNKNDIGSYKISVTTLDPVGEVEGVYELTSLEQRLNVTGLTEDRDYYFAVSAINKKGYESVAIEKMFAPSSLPQTPVGLSVTPTKDEVILTWSANPEHDIVGYNIYRMATSELAETPYILKHQETSFIDANLNKNQNYYYAITAIDEEGNESPPTEAIKTGLFSLDCGILIVNATPEGTGEPYLPTEPALRQYYDKILAPFNTSYLRIDEETALTISDIGFYSTVLIFNDSIQRIKNDFSETFLEYLEGNGKLIISGFNPLTLFGCPADNSLPSVTPNLDFLIGQLGIKSTYHNFGSYFTYAHSQNESYPDLPLAKDKLSNSTDSHLINIVAYNPDEEAQVLYRYGTDYPVDSPSGFMADSVVGIKKGDAVTLSFPLYYLEEEKVEHFLKSLLHESFSEKYDKYSEEINKPVYLLPNYPNPFNNSTTIPYYLEKEGNITLKIYNIKGQLISELYKGAGTIGRSKIVWSGADSKDRLLPSGIYILAIEQGKYHHQRKIFLLK